MKSSAASLGLSTQKIVARIEKVRRAAEKAAKSKKRFAQFRYLRSVFRAYLYLDDNHLLSHLIEIAPSVFRARVRSDFHPLRVIIEASCFRVDLKTRSRWTRALQYAVAEKVDPDELVQFIRAHNGIAGCAELASKIKPRRSPPPRQTCHGRRTTPRQIVSRIASGPTIRLMTLLGGAG